MNNALSKKRLFLDHPSPKGFYRGALYIPPKSGKKLSHISPKTQDKVLSKSFSGDSFRLRKESPRSESRRGKRKLAFFFPYVTRTGGEAKLLRQK